MVLGCCETIQHFLWLYGCVNMYLSFTNPDGGVVETNRLILHCIRTLRTGFRVTSTGIKYCIKGNISLNGVLIQLEHNSNPVRIHSFAGFTRFTVHELRQERLRVPLGTFTIPDGGVVKTNRQYYSIAFEHFLFICLLIIVNQITLVPMFEYNYQN